MSLDIKQLKESARRSLELMEALEKAQTEDERQEILKELKEIAMAQLGVEGTA